METLYKNIKMTKGLSAKTITTINEIMETIECSNWEIDTKDKRYINYKCHCGKDGKTLKQGIFRPQWNGCSDCSKKKISSEVIDLITDILKKNKCELISFGKGTRVKYRCSCKNETEADFSGIRKSTWGGCTKCSNQRRGNTNDYEYARKVWEEGGEKLPIQEYSGNKDKLFYTCSNCNEEAHVSLGEFNRGRRCEKCSRERTKETNLEKYGVENPFQSEEIKKKIKEKNLEKYGVDHHMKVPEILQKAQDTHMEKYGFAFAFHSKESFEKIHITCMERYGAKYPLQNEYIRKKAIESCRESLGVDYPFQNQNYMKQICLELYGVEYPLQNEDIFHKMLVSAYQRKEYIFPSGRVEYCQGYEPRCLDVLLNSGYDEDDIVVGYRGREAIWYDNPITGETSRYFPDGFIISENAVIEVKSDYYYDKDLEKNIAKFNAVVSMGFNVNLYVFNKVGLLFVTIYTSTSVTVSNYQYAELVFED